MTTLARAPLRISLAGGGTDIRSYADRRGGHIVGLAIDRYILAMAHPHEFASGVRIRSERSEWARGTDQLESPFDGAILRRSGIVSDVQLASLSDVPANSGLGGSAAYVVASMIALNRLAGRLMTATEVAEAAAAVEIEDLGRPVGKQDHYLSALGGLQSLTVGTDRRVVARSLPVSSNVRRYVSQNLLLFFTDQVRDASHVLMHQHSIVESGDAEAVRVLDGIRALASELESALRAGDPSSIGDILHEHWMLKQQLGSTVSTPRANDLYAQACDAGAGGGKLLGAGGGGFLLVAVPDPAIDAVRAAMRQAEAPELVFGLSDEGAVSTTLAAVSIPDDQATPR